MNKLQETRWHNTHLVLKENALDVETFAMCLGVDDVKLKKMIDSPEHSKITDALAKKIEQTFSKPEGWLSQAENGLITFDLFGAN